MREETSGRLRGPVVTGRVGGLLYGGDYNLNHGAEAAEVPLPAGCRSLLDGGRELGQVTLEPGGVAVLEEAGR